MHHGKGVINSYGGIPFPITQDPVEIVWNHILRWRGIYVQRTSAEANVQSNGRSMLTKSFSEVSFSYYDKDSEYEDLNNNVFYFLTHKKPSSICRRSYTGS